MNLKLTALLPIMLLSGCGSDDGLTINSISVSDFYFTSSDQPAVSISLIQDDKNFCEVTLFRSNVRDGYSATVSQKSIGELSSSCHLNGKYFIQSSKHPTVASLTINSLDNQSQTATLDVNLKLVNNKTLKDFFELNNVQLSISGDQFANLVTMPKE